MSSSVVEIQPAVPTTDSLDSNPGDEVLIDQRPRSVVLGDWLTANPLVAPAVGLMVGIFTDAWWPVPVWLACVLFVAAGWCLVRQVRSSLAGCIALLLAAAAVGSVLHDVAYRRWPTNHIVRYASSEGRTVRLRGKVVSAPTISSPSDGAAWYAELPRTRFVVSAESIGGGDRQLRVSGLVRVAVSGPVLEASAGDYVELVGTLRGIGPPANPGGINWALVNRRSGVLVDLHCRRVGDVKVVTSDPWRWRTWLDRLRQRARGAMLEGTYPGDVPGSGLLAGMVLGQRSAISPDLNEAFVRSGTVHYLSVSGAHVGMLVGAVWTAGWLLGIGRRRCAGWAMLAATGYALLAEPSAPIVRAALMTDLACLALLCRRPVRVANCLALSALVLLVARPTQLFNAGFQLSYVTLLSVIYVSPRLHYACARLCRRLARRDDPLLSPEIQQQLGMRSVYWTYWDRVARGLGWYLAVGLAASGVGALLSAHHFHQVQCWGWINTIVLMPLIWLVMVLGLIKTGVAAVAPWLSRPMGGMLAWLTDLLIGLVEAMARVPAAAFATPAVPVALVGFGLVVVLLWTVQPALRLPRPCSRIPAFLFLIAAAWFLAPPAAERVLTMQVLAVGNGSTSVIRLPNGKTLMYDVGSFPPYDLERWTAGPLLSQERCWRIDGVFISHANLDHYSGLPGLLDRRWVDRIITTPHFEHAGQGHSTARELIARLKARPHRWQRAARGARITGTGDAELEVLWPPAEEIPTGESNDTSLVLRISYAGKRILACGDIEEYALRQLMATTDVRADVLILPHHGSVTASTAAFVRAVNPRYCIRSTGQRTTSPTLRSVVAGREYLSTADNGAIEVRIEPDGLKVMPRFASRSAGS